MSFHFDNVIENFHAKEWRWQRFDNNNYDDEKWRLPSALVAELWNERVVPSNEMKENLWKDDGDNLHELFSLELYECNGNDISFVISVLLK